MSGLGNKEIMARNIQKYMDLQGIDRTTLSKRLGVSYTTLTDWIKGNTYPRIDKIELLANYFGIAKSDLVEDKLTDIQSIYNKLHPNRQNKVFNFAQRQLEEQNKVVPLVGSTAANPTELTYGDPIYDEVVSTDVPEKADCAIIVRGDSMEPMFKDGSIVFYKRQETIESGQIGVVEIDGDGVTLKKVILDYENNQIILRSLNKKYYDRILNNDEARVIGVIVK